MKYFWQLLVVQIPMLRPVVFSVLTGALAGVQFELLANEVPHAALLNAFILHVWIVVSGIWSASFYQYLFQSKIPFKWSLGIVMLVSLIKSVRNNIQYHQTIH